MSQGILAHQTSSSQDRKPYLTNNWQNTMPASAFHLNHHHTRLANSMLRRYARGKIFIFRGLRDRKIRQDWPFGRLSLLRCADDFDRLHMLKPSAEAHHPFGTLSERPGSWYPPIPIPIPIPHPSSLIPRGHAFYLHLAAHRSYPEELLESE